MPAFTAQPKASRSNCSQRGEGEKESAEASCRCGPSVHHRNPDTSEERGRESDANLFSSILREELKESGKQNEMEGEGKR